MDNYASWSAVIPKIAQLADSRPGVADELNKILVAKILDMALKNRLFDLGKALLQLDVAEQAIIPKLVEIPVEVAITY
jgi:hypothetical protein